MNKDVCYIKCHCGAEIIHCDRDPEDGLIYFGIFKYLYWGGKLSWKQRFRYCWHVIRTGEAFKDEIVLDQQGADELANFLKAKEN